MESMNEDMIKEYLEKGGEFSQHVEEYLEFSNEETEIRSVGLLDKSYPNEVSVCVTVKFDYCSYEDQVKITIKLIDLLGFVYGKAIG